MAGSYNHVVNTKTGALLKPEKALGMLECYHNDVYEALEEMYGMIWFLANEVYWSDRELHEGPTEKTVESVLENARQNYRKGLQISPTKRYHS